MTYQAVFERADDGTVFAYVPDLPGCTSWGPTLDEARHNVGEAIDLWIATAKEHGIDVPPPSAPVKHGAA
jgi:antitoxin HicB